MPVEEKLMGAAILFAVIPDFWSSAPKFGCPGIEPQNPPISVAGINRKRQLFKEFR
jgi:hypothetical protein